MKKLRVVVACIGLGLTVIPSFLVFAGSITLDSSKFLMLLGTILWFAAASSWLGADENQDSRSVPESIEVARRSENADIGA